jgi:transposase
MDLSELLIESLAMQDVKIEKHKSCRKTRKLELWVRQQREDACCYVCAGALYEVHSWRQRVLKGPPIGAFNHVKIYYFQLQAACDMCQRVRLAWVPYIHPGFKNVTTAFAEVAGQMMEEMTCEAVSRLLVCNSKQLWKLDQWRMQKMKESERYKKLLEVANVSLMSADEVHMRTIKPKNKKYKKQEWTKKFITNLVCYNHSKVIANAAGRTARSLKKCLMELTDEQRLAVQFLAVDMHDGFISSARELCPNAKIAVDRFHLAQKLNEKFDEVRKEELAKVKKQTEKHEFLEGMLSGSKRFILVEREKDKLPQSDRNDLEKLKMLNENINTAMILVEYFHRLLDRKTVKSFSTGLDKWFGLVRGSGLKPLKAFAKLVKKYLEEIKTYVSSHLTTAVSEGLNNKIKVLKRMGYGYTNQESFMNKILQRCGFLNSTHLDTTGWIWGDFEDLA